MTKLEITNLLEEKHQILFEWLANQPENIWEKNPEGKWTTGQHFLHLVNSIQLLNNALSYPKFILKYKYGTCNREIRSYETIVEKYLEKLAKHPERSKKFNKNLKTPILNDKPYLLNRLQIQNKKLQYKTHKISEADLDQLLVPHPLMGKMTLREIIMWTAYHTQHHTEILKHNYQSF